MGQQEGREFLSLPFTCFLGEKIRKVIVHLFLTDFALQGVPNS